MEDLDDNFEYFSSSVFTGLTQEIKDMKGLSDLPELYVKAINEQLQIKDNETEYDYDDYEINSILEDDEQIFNCDENGNDETTIPVVKTLPYPKSRSWSAFISSIKTNSKYERIIQDFYDWANAKMFPKNEREYFDDPEILLEYFTEKKVIIDSNGKFRYSSSTLKSMYSVFKTFWEKSLLGKLDETFPLLDTLLHNWNKGHQYKKALVFTKENIGN